MVVAARKPASGPKGKKKSQTFVIDCTKPVDDKIMDIASFETFLTEKIKVDGKAGESVRSTAHDLTQLPAVFTCPVLLMHAAHALTSCRPLWITNSFSFDSLNHRRSLAREAIPEQAAWEQARDYAIDRNTAERHEKRQWICPVDLLCSISAASAVVAAVL